MGPAGGHISGPTRLGKKSVGPAGGRNHGPTIVGQKSLGPAGGRFPLLFAPGGFGAKVPGPCRGAIPPAVLPLKISVAPAIRPSLRRMYPRERTPANVHSEKVGKGRVSRPLRRGLAKPVGFWCRAQARQAKRRLACAGMKAGSNACACLIHACPGSTKAWNTGLPCVTPE